MEQEIKATIESEEELKGTIDLEALTGPRGYSAYELAVQNGYKGTEAEWLNSFDKVNYYKSLRFEFTVSKANTTEFEIDVPNINETYIVSVYINGTKLMESDYTVTATKLTLKEPLNVIGTEVIIEVLRSVVATTEGYELLRGEKGDKGDKGEDGLDGTVAEKPKAFLNAIVENGTQLEQCGAFPIKKINKILGNTQQNTREGYNLLNLPDYTETKAGVSLNIKNGEVSMSGTLPYGISFFIPITDIELKTTDIFSVALNENKTTLNGFGIYLADENKNLIRWSYGQAGLQNKTGFSPTTDVVAKYFHLALNIADVDYTGYNFKPIFERGSVSHEFEQYGSMPSIDYPSDIRVVEGSYENEIYNENLFDLNDTIDTNKNYIINNDDSLTLTYDNTEGTEAKYFNYYTNKTDRLKPNTKYYVVVEILNVSGNGRLNAISYNATMQPPQYKEEYRGSYLFSDLKNGDIKKIEITTIQDFSNAKNMLRTFCSFTVGQSGSITFRISVLEDEPNISSFKYIPYQSQTYNLDFPEGMEFAKGDEIELTYTEKNGYKTIDRDSVYHIKNWNRYDVTGNESWYLIESDNRIGADFITELSNAKDDVSCYSNIASYYPWGTKENSIDVRNTKLRLSNKTHNYTLSEFISLAQNLYNNGTPMYVIYQLATPTRTQITDENFISQYEALLNSSLYEGQNNFSITGDSVSFKIDMDYWTWYKGETGAGQQYEAGEGIDITDNVISATNIAGLNITKLYDDATESVSTKTATLTDDSWLNYKMLAFKYKSVAGLSAWGFVIMDTSIDTSEIYQLHLIDNKHGTSDVGSVRGIKIQFVSETELTAFARNQGNTECWLTQIWGIK